MVTSSRTPHAQERELQLEYGLSVRESEVVAARGRADQCRDARLMGNQAVGQQSVVRARARACGSMRRVRAPSPVLARPPGGRRTALRDVVERTRGGGRGLELDAADHGDQTANDG